MEKRKQTREPKQDKRQKKTKDPNQPKRPPSAFFVFMLVSSLLRFFLSIHRSLFTFNLVVSFSFHSCREDFRKSYKEKHPEVKSVATVGKAGGNKWSSMTDDVKLQIFTSCCLFFTLLHESRV